MTHHAQEAMVRAEAAARRALRADRYRRILEVAARLHHGVLTTDPRTTARLALDHAAALVDEWERRYPEAQNP